MNSVLPDSQATETFKADLARFMSGDRPERVKVEGFIPAVKVRRVLTQLLASEAGLEIEEVVIRGSSGCSNIVGSVDVQTATGTHVFDFVWCCRWRAEAEGYVDYFGYPDQTRAAREFDWRCFQKWQRRTSN